MIPTRDDPRNFRVDRFRNLILAVEAAPESKWDMGTTFRCTPDAPAHYVPSPDICAAACAFGWYVLYFYSPGPGHPDSPADPRHPLHARLIQADPPRHAHDRLWWSDRGWITTATPIGLPLWGITAFSYHFGVAYPTAVNLTSPFCYPHRTDARHSPLGYYDTSKANVLARLRALEAAMTMP